MARSTAVTVLPLHREPVDDVITFDNVAAGMWTTDQVAAFFGTSRSATFEAVTRGDFDDVIIRVGRRVIWPGPALARKLGVPGFGEEVTSRGTHR
jgi:hypothetical protein